MGYAANAKVTVLNSIESPYFVLRNMIGNKESLFSTNGAVATA